MQIESLKIFCDVVRFHSFSRAALANEVSQPAASQVVNQIEKRLGLQLIDRSRRPWELTEEGRIYYEGCQEIVESHAKLEAELRRRTRSPEYTVRVSAIYSVGFQDIGKIIERFRLEVPGSDVQIEYVHPDQVYQAVLTDEADLGLISFPHPGREILALAWREEMVGVVGRPDHRLARRTEIIAAELDGESLVTFERGMTVRRELDRYLRRHEVEVTVVGEFDNIDTIKRAVEDGVGVALLPEPTVRREVEAGTLAFTRLAGEPLIRPLGIIHRRRRPLNPAVTRFIELLAEENVPTAVPAAADAG